MTYVTSRMPSNCNPTSRRLLRTAQQPYPAITSAERCVACALAPRSSRGLAAHNGCHPMTRDTVVIGFAGALAACVLLAGIGGRFASADPHQFDALLGLSPGECQATANASEVKPLAPLATRQ